MYEVLTTAVGALVALYTNFTAVLVVFFLLSPANVHDAPFARLLLPNSYWAYWGEAVTSARGVQRPRGSRDLLGPPERGETHADRRKPSAPQRRWQRRWPGAEGARGSSARPRARDLRLGSPGWRWHRCSPGPPRSGRSVAVTGPGTRYGC
jgi:hypothetical protein